MPTEAWRSDAARMVERLGPLPPRIAQALAAVPRHRFVPLEVHDAAYEDEALPLERSFSTISAPHMVAVQLDQALLAPGQHVLEIGSGSGYLLALIAELVGSEGRVIGMELDPALAQGSWERLVALGYGDRIVVVPADGAGGWPSGAPYDRILVSCAIPSIRRAWREQLRPDGALIAPVGPSLGQELVRWRPGRTLERGVQCRFVPLRGRSPPDI